MALIHRPDSVTPGPIPAAVSSPACSLRPSGGSWDGRAWSFHPAHRLPRIPAMFLQPAVPSIPTLDCPYATPRLSRLGALRDLTSPSSTAPWAGGGKRRDILQFPTGPLSWRSHPGTSMTADPLSRLGRHLS